MKFKIFGIDFIVSVGFAGILCLMLYIDKTGQMLPTVLAVMAHEFGHLIVLILFKSKPQKIELKIGAVGIIGKFCLEPKKEVIMLTAGSAFNIVLFITLYYLYSLCGVKSILNFSLVMFVVGVFNILPIIGLDGGSILNIALHFFLKTKTANFLSFVISLVTITLIVVLGFYILYDTKSNISLILMGIYLFLGILMSKSKKNDCKIFKNIVE